MPVGEFAYQGREGKHTCVHTECMAQVLTKEAQRDEEVRNEREQQKKILNRREYDIGWRMDTVPQNLPLAERMGCKASPQGLCCLVLDDASKTIRVAATLEPSAAVNLEYLLLALKVRKTASREPLFSLDPVDPQNMESTPQKKVYEPNWLAGTSAGDVMFQADYFLKELALGEYAMPVVGMSSVFDFSEMTGKENQWAGSNLSFFVSCKGQVSETIELRTWVVCGEEGRSSRGWRQHPHPSCEDGCWGSECLKKDSWLFNWGTFTRSVKLISILPVTGSRTGADKEWPGRCTCDPS